MSNVGYEFQIVEWRVGDTVWGLLDKLNGLGEFGWQIVGIHPADPTTLLVFMQRPREASPPRFTMGEM